MLRRTLLLVSAVLVSSAVVLGNDRVIHTFRGGHTPGDFGRAVANAGDVDGDGMADVLVGAPFCSNGTPEGDGMLRVYSGRDGTTLHTFVSQYPLSYFGYSISTAGDVDGDGHDDVLVGAMGEKKWAGAAYVFSGRDGSTLFAFEGTRSASLGCSVDGGTDLDGDGVADLLVGACSAAGGRGKIFVYSGADGSVLLELRGSSAGRFLGTKVAWAGDIDADGKSDIIANRTGGVFVFSGEDGEVLHKVETDGCNGFGEVIGPAGDANGDGFGDFFFTDPAHREGNLSGFVYVHSGRDGSLIRSHSNAGSHHPFGHAVEPWGDFDSDGFDDLVVSSLGCPGVSDGAVRVLSGRDGSVLRRFEGEGAFGTAIASAGDLDHDGVPELLVSNPSVDLEGEQVGAVYVISGRVSDATWQPYGEGWPGTYGVPRLALDAPPVLGTKVGLEIGSSSGEATLAMVFLGHSSAELRTSLGGMLLLTPQAQWTLPLAPEGTTLDVPLPDSAGLDGASFYLQAIQLDPGASKGLSFSRGLKATLGR